MRPGATFSVVLCTFNRAAVVGRAVRSVLDQTYGSFELIVVDDGSADRTPEVIASFDDPRLHGIRRSNGGLSAARNSGIEAATGRFVAFLDDDDEVDGDWLEGLASVMDQRTGLVSCSCRMVTPDRASTSICAASPHPLFPDVRGAFVAGTFAVERSILVDVGGYDERIRVNHQTELLLRVLPELERRRLTAALIDRPLVTIEQREPRDRPLRHPRALLEGTELLIDEHGEALARGAAPTLASYHAVAGVSAARLGQLDRARRHFWAAVRTHPTRLKHLAQLGAACLPSLACRVWPGDRAA